MIKWIVFDFTRELLELHVITIVKQWMSIAYLVGDRVFTGTSLVLWYSSSGMRPCVGRRETPDRSIGVISTTIPMQGTSSGTGTAATHKTSIQWFSTCTVLSHGMLVLSVNMLGSASSVLKSSMNSYFFCSQFPEIKEIKVFYSLTNFRQRNLLFFSILRKSKLHYFL